LSCRSTDVGKKSLSRRGIAFAEPEAAGWLVAKVEKDSAFRASVMAVDKIAVGFEDRRRESERCA